MVAVVAAIPPPEVTHFLRQVFRSLMPFCSRPLNIWAPRVMRPRGVSGSTENEGPVGKWYKFSCDHF